MKTFLPVFIGLFLFLSTLPVFAQVKINEFLIRPNPEWIELYNASDSAEYLKNYWLDDDTDFDSDSGTSPKKSLAGLKTDSIHFVYFVTNSFLNDDGDMVVLFDNQKNVIDNFQFTVNPGDNLTIGRYPDETGSFTILKEPTQGWANSPPQPPASPSPSPSNQPDSSPLSSSTNPTPLTAIPTPPPSPSPTPQPSKVYRIKEISLLNLSPAPVLGTTSSQLSTSAKTDNNWQLARLLLTAGTGLLLVTTVIMIKSWHKQ